MSAGIRAQPSTVVSADAGYQLVSGTRIQVSMLNALNGRAEDIQYYYASRLQGEPADGAGMREKYRMAMVFQSAALLTSLSVGENVGLYLAEHGLKTPGEIADIVARKLEAVGLKGLEDRVPSELSGGMQKRVAIARALVMEPQLFLFDEPTAELDPPMAATIDEEILKLKNRTHATSIIVTHDRTLAFSLADRVAMFIDGQILFIGTPDEVKRHADPRIQDFINAKPQPSKSL